MSLSVASSALLRHDDGTLVLTLYDDELAEVGGVDALEVRGAAPEVLDADAGSVFAKFELAVPVRLEQRAGRLVAVLGEPAGK